MADESVNVDKILTAFLLNTCRLLPQPSIRAVQAAVQRAMVASRRLKDFGFIPLITGSVAEFYIEPMIENIGDVDVMFYADNMLAIPRGRLPPTRLPAEFQKIINTSRYLRSLILCYLVTCT